MHITSGCKEPELGRGVLGNTESGRVNRLSQGSHCYTTGFRKSGKDGRKSCKTGNRMGLGRQNNHPVVPSQFYVNDLTTGLYWRLAYKSQHSFQISSISRY